MIRITTLAAVPAKRQPITTPSTSCAALTISKGGLKSLQPAEWTSALTSMGPRRFLAGSLRRCPPRAPARPHPISHSSEAIGVAKTDTAPALRFSETPSSHWMANGTVITISRMRTEWTSAMTRESPPRSSPMVTISTSPPGMPAK